MGHDFGHDRGRQVQGACRLFLLNIALSPCFIAQSGHIFLEARLRFSPKADMRGARCDEVIIEKNKIKYRRVEMKKVIVITVLLFLVIVLSVSATTINVPADYSTIQAAINASSGDDSILVSPGTYIENLAYPTHRIILKSTSGADSTFIHYAGWSQYQFYINHSDSGSTIEGFTINDAIGPNTIIRITGNTAGFEIRHCKFINNHVDEIIRGDGYASLKVSYCTFVNPQTQNPIVSVGSNCSFINNTVDSGIDGLAIYGFYSSILNNIIVNLTGYAIYNPHVSSTVDYNNFWQNGYNNFPGPNGVSEDPFFFGGTPFDYNLQSISPCIDSGDPDYLYNDPDGTRSDMGSYPLAGFDINYPFAQYINFGSLANGIYVYTTEPEIFWSFVDTFAVNQTIFHIEVGTDRDWAIAEMWNSGPITSQDTSVTYSGSPLLYSETYHLRIRLNNGTVWGSWKHATFSIRDTIHVPSEQPLIQSAINVSIDGDIVSVAPGTYHEHLDFLGKAIEVSSQAGPEMTIIEGVYYGVSIVSFNQGEGARSIISGFSLTGVVSNMVAVITCMNTSPTIHGNIICDNNNIYYGGGILCQGPLASSYINGNVIYNNQAERGGGIYVHDVK